ncbi:glycoside hydrolase 5 family protein [Flavobacterium luteum]|uniref:Glycosidase n=1 Tax=Flavobacterium luteum TaxID=2026654 RepID=A0A7J5ABP7_9FLAO|nr:glycosidase [Flavobacterium luteum]KAB1154848.1 glycosidase [Flavobacterium luteum]
MKKNICLLIFSFCALSIYSQADKVSLDKSSEGIKLKVDGNDLMINGMNWDYFPIGTNYTYSLWKQSDNVIQQALDDEMSLLKNMGVNAIRVYTGMPKKWIEYVYSKYGIYTMLNHSFGRYGLTIDGAWIPTTEYADAKTRQLLLKEVKEMAQEYKDTKGLLLFLLGNENNYGLFWDGAETENIPVKDRKSTKRAEYMYKLFNEAIVAMKSIDTSHPVAICNGDLLFLDIIAKDCPDVDILGINAYRGISFGDIFERVKKEYGKPVLFSEFGSDAFNAVSGQEDQNGQAAILKGNWKEIYENAAGLGKAGNSLGGFTFQFSDGWWKFGQTKYLDIHDTNASWSNGGYAFDYVKGENNMNEEWFGVCAKGPTNANGNYQLFPRSAYYILKEVHQFNPYTNGKSLTDLDNYFNKIQIMDASLKARSDKSALDSQKGGKIKFSRLAAEFTTFNTGGEKISTPSTAPVNNTTFPNQLGFDHMESYFIGVEASPASNMTANVEFNILGNVALNPIDEIFYENRARPTIVSGPNGDVTLQDNNRVQVYRASYKWDEKLFNLNGFYRTGHYHWGYEGDFFGLYPEANYGPNIDIYNGLAPFGFEVEGKKIFKGLKLAAGPQLWWGANPAALLKYSKNIAKFDVTGIFHEDLEQRGLAESSLAVPQPKTRRFTLHANRKFGKFGLDVGGIWAGQPLNGREYQVLRTEGGINVAKSATIESKDNLGAKLKLTYTGGKFNWYAQAAAQGLVAGGGAGDQTQTFTGWRLKDSGSGNQYNFLTGATYTIGKLQIAPNFLWQKPLEEAITADAVGGRLRNILQDPFVVRGNREQVAGELLLTYDPTPGTWMYEWDNDRSEDAKFAVSAGFVFRHLPTTQDAAIGFLANRTAFAFPNSVPAKDLWEANARIVSKLSADLGFIANIYGGPAQGNGSDARTINRYGMDLRTLYNKVKFNSSVKVNDFGPFDYHRDFNLTYPLQLMGDVSFGIGKADWFLLPGTRIGLRGTWRSLDQYSNRYVSGATKLDGLGNVVPDPKAPGYANGQEWEIRTYIQINIAN